jgi:DHA1 family tetracycline resistance protein-like MFS transporter
MFIVITVALDAMGVGLIVPVMPELIREIRGTSISDAAYWGGLLSFTYAFMQFLCGPLLGNLSDRFGRRPVLIVSLIFMGLDYLLMAVAPSLMLLFVARLVSGVTGATYSTASAYLADTSKKGNRASNFGLIGAAFGIGFVLGPALGGLLGEFGLRMPFLVAAGLALLNAAFGLLVLPETLPKARRRQFEWRRADPLRALLRVRNLPAVGGLMLVLLVFCVGQNVYAVIWSYFTIEKFSWSLATVGLSLAAYGSCAALVQISLLGRMVRRWGEDNTARFGIAISVAAMVGIVFLNQGWMIFAGMPIVALGAVVGPSLQAMMSDRVDDHEQGELQGVYSSIIAIASIVSPLLMTTVFREFTKVDTVYYLPSAPFLVAAMLALLSLCVLQWTKRARITSLSKTIK